MKILTPHAHTNPQIKITVAVAVSVADMSCTEPDQDITMPSIQPPLSRLPASRQRPERRREYPDPPPPVSYFGKFKS